MNVYSRLLDSDPLPVNSCSTLAKLLNFSVVYWTTQGDSYHLIYRIIVNLKWNDEKLYLAQYLAYYSLTN